MIIIIGERAKRTRHSQVCSIENRGYIYIFYIVLANFVLITHKEGGAYFEISARTLCLRVCGATPRFTAAVKIPLPMQHFSSRILFDRKLSEKLFLLTMDQTKRETFT